VHNAGDLISNQGWDEAYLTIRLIGTSVNCFFFFLPDNNSGAVFPCLNDEIHAENSLLT
jgi:hypothetical protein